MSRMVFYLASGVNRVWFEMYAVWTMTFLIVFVAYIRIVSFGTCHHAPVMVYIVNNVWFGMFPQWHDDSGCCLCDLCDEFGSCP